MIRISHEHKAIFCHIPKCGGTSVERVLDSWERISHVRKCTHEFMHNDRFIGMGQYIYDYLPRYWVFTIVRDPYMRYISGLNHVAKNHKPNPYWMYEHLHASQTETLGELIPDYIMRLENIAEDWKIIQDRFGVGELPHVNRSRGGELTAEIINHVNIRYKIDFKKFGYNLNSF